MSSGEVFGDASSIPFSPFDERSVLGSLLRGDGAAQALALGTLVLEDFYLPHHRRLADVILSMHRNGCPVSVESVIHELSDAGLLDAAGGAASIQSASRQQADLFGSIAVLVAMRRARSGMGRP